MDGENQRGCYSEWTSELPNRTLRAVGFGEMALSLQKAGIKHSIMLDAVKRAEFRLNKVAPRVSRPYFI